MQLVKRYYGEKIIATAAHPMTFDQDVQLEIKVEGPLVTGYVNGTQVLTYNDTHNAMLSGGIGMAVEEGRLLISEVSIGN